MKLICLKVKNVLIHNNPITKACLYIRRDGPGGGAYFVAYEWVKRAMGKYYGPTSKFTESIIAGGLAGNLLAQSFNLYAV